MVEVVLSVRHVYTYSRACGSHQDFLDRGILPTNTLLKKGSYGEVEVNTSKIYGRQHELTCLTDSITYTMLHVYLLAHVALGA
jgi:hypothetical protein